ncbi:MAG: hypothetical protein QW727_03790 [Candidatus Pacearchaeota archaeon]
MSRKKQERNENFEKISNVDEYNQKNKHEENVKRAYEDLAPNLFGVSSSQREDIYNRLTLMFGRVVEAYPTTNFYLVIPLSYNQTAISCSSISKNSNLFGVRDQSGFNVGDLVIFMYDSMEGRGYIIGSWFEPLLLKNDLVGDRISELSITLKDLVPLLYLVSMGIGSLVSGAMNVDSYPSDFCKSTETGSMIFLDRFMSFLRASDFCGIWAFYNDYLLREKFHNFEKWCPYYEEQIKSDPLFAKNLENFQDAKIIKENSISKVFETHLMRGWQFANLARFDEDIWGVNVSKINRSYLLSPSEGKLLNLTEETINAAGTHSIRVARALFLLQSFPKLVYVRVKNPDDLDGDDSSTVDLMNEEIVFELKNHSSYDQYKNKVSSLASGIIDKLNFYFNVELLKNLKGRTKDYLIKNPNSIRKFISPKGDPNKKIKILKKLKQDGSYEEVELTSSDQGTFFSILEDGTAVMGNGAGCEFRMEKDAIYIRAPKIFIQSGDKTILWGGNNIYCRAREDIEISSTKGDLKLNSTKGDTDIHGKNVNISCTDGNLNLSNQTGAAKEKVTAAEVSHITINREYIKICSPIEEDDDEKKGRIILSAIEVYINGKDSVICDDYPVFHNLEVFAFNEYSCPAFIPEPLWYRLYVTENITDKHEDWIEEKHPISESSPWGTQKDEDEIYKQEVGFTNTGNNEFGESKTEKIKEKWPVFKPCN